MEISAAMVKTLRDKTGLSMMDCKQALVEAAGDQEKAVEVLRKKGAGRIDKMADREASQGRIAAYVDAANKRGGIIELRCETAPVAKTDDFIQLAGLLARQVAAMENPSVESLPAQPLLDEPSRKVQDRITDVFNRLRENMVIKRVSRLTGHLGMYVHHDGQKGALVEMSADCPDSVRTDVCMHITAVKPACTRREQVDPALVAKERELAMESVKGKPANIIQKIVDGKIDRWYGEIVLLEQPFVKEEKKSVGQMLRDVSPSLTVNGFVRFEVGAS